MKKSRPLIFISLISITLVISIFSRSSFSWLPGAELTDPVITGSVLTNYFESGDGTEQYPFIIHSPRHLYNLAWLQYNGYFNKTDGNGALKQYYFKLCDGDWTDNKTGLKTTCGGLEDHTLDMTDWVLPPIGTYEYPFIGHFDGMINSNGTATGNVSKISNLHISGCWDDLTDPALEEDVFIANGDYDGNDDGCDIVGLFGVVGAIKSGDSVGSIGGASYTSSVNVIKDFAVESITVKSGTSATLTGLTVGYANGTESTLSGVRLETDSASATGASTVQAVYGTSNSACSHLSLTENVSDYTIVGYCNDAMKGTLESTETNIGIPSYTTSSTGTTSGSGNSWGSSLDLRKLFERIDDVFENASTSSWVYLIDGGTRNLDGTVTGGTTDSAQFYHSAASGEGSYTLSAATFDTGIQFKYISGGAHVTNGTVYEADVKDAYIISDGTQYLNLTFSGSTPAITSGTDAATATKWVFENDTLTGKSGKMYTVYDQTQYFMNRVSGSSNIEASTTGTTSWTLVEDTSSSSATTSSTTATTLNGSIKTDGLFLKYNGTKWMLAGNTNIVCTLGSGDSKVTKYLGISGGQPVKDVQTAWFFEEYTESDNTKSYRISGYEGTQKYYLCAGNTSKDLEQLTLGTATNSATRWQLDDDMIYITSPKEYVIAWYEDDWKLAYSEFDKIQDGNGHYLGVAGSSGSFTFTDADNCRWIIESVTGGSNISVVKGGTKYYLNYTGSALSLNAGSSTVWTVSADKSISCTSGGVQLTLQYIDGSWQMVGCFTIKDENNVYLGANTTGLTTTSTNWIFLDPTLTNSYMCVRYGTADYYLNITGSTTFSISTTKSTRWTWDSSANILKGTNDSTNYYSLYYDNGWKLGSYYASNCRIVQTTDENYYMLLTNSSDIDTTDSRDSATVWECYWPSSNTIQLEAEYGNKTYWLGYVYRSIWKIGNYLRAQRSDRAVTWNYSTTGSGQQLSMLYNGNTYYMTCLEILSLNSWTAWALSGIYVNIIYPYPTMSLAAADPSIKIQEIEWDTDQTASYQPAEQLVLTKQRIKDVVKKTGQDFWDYNRDNVTYMPLTTDSNNIVTSANTGYILGGSKNQESTGSFPTKSGDIRFGRHLRVTSNQYISSDYVANSSIGASTRYVKTALTIGKNGQGTLGTDYSEAMFQRYSTTSSTGTTTGAKAGFEAVMQSNLFFYGIHFMDAEIDMDNLIPVDSATIEKSTYEDYEMPASSIDFQLQSRGFITFFAGTYYDNNNAFFSLHHIFREKDRFEEASSTNKKAILAIYQRSSGTGPEWIYKCSDGEFYKNDASGTALTGAVLPDNFESAYTQINTKVYMYAEDVTQPLIYQYANGNLFQFTMGSESPISSVSELPADYINANDIWKLKEIETIFGVYKENSTTINTDIEYIYRYTDATYSVALGSGQTGRDAFTYNGYSYQTIFKTAWLTDPVSNVGAGKTFNATNGLYYFEVPANAGEYALGSVKDKSGAYLLYLDIAASATSVRSQTITEVKEIKQNSFNYPLGVQIRREDQTSSFDAQDSATVSLVAGGTATLFRVEASGGDYFSINDSGITVGSVPYVGNSLSVRLASKTEDVTVGTPAKTRTTQVEKTIFNQNQDTKQISTAQKTTTVTIAESSSGTKTITKTVEENGETYSETLSSYTINTPLNYLLKTHSSLYAPLTDETTPIASATAYDYGLNDNGEMVEFTSITASFTSESTEHWLVLDSSITTPYTIPDTTVAIEQLVITPTPSTEKIITFTTN